jgi:hypothetical protein
VPDETVNRFADEIGVAVVTHVFLDHVKQDIENKAATGRCPVAAAVAL